MERRNQGEKKPAFCQKRKPKAISQRKSSKRKKKKDQQATGGKCGFPLDPMEKGSAPARKRSQGRGLDRGEKKGPSSIQLEKRKKNIPPQKKGSAIQEGESEKNFSSGDSTQKLKGTDFSKKRREILRRGGKKKF